MWSHPLPTDEPVTGSLNLYVRRGGDPGTRAAAADLVERAVVPVTNVWLYAEAVRNADTALEALVRTSNDTNRKLRDVAQAVVDTGEIPR